MPALCGIPVSQKNKLSKWSLFKNERFRIIYNSNCLDYKNFCLIHQLQTLSDRRDIYCVNLFSTNKSSVVIAAYITYFLNPEFPSTID